MKKVLLFAGMLITFSFTSESQTTFQKVFKGSEGWSPFDKPAGLSYCVNVTIDGGYIVGASPSQTCAGPATFIRLDANGDTLWIRKYKFAGSIADNIHSIEQTTDGGFIAGICEGVSRVLKTDSSGNLLWAKEYSGNSYHTYVHQTSDGGYVIAGDVSPGAGMGDGQLIKTDSIGDTTWTKSYGGVNYENFFSVIQTTDGGYLATGRTRSYPVPGANWNGYVVKTNASGDTLWTRVYGYASISGSINSAIESNGGYIFQGTLDSGSYLLKTNLAGDIIWSKRYTDTIFSIFIHSFIQTDDGGFAMTGSAFNTILQLDAIMLKTDSAGNYQWLQLYGGAGTDRGYSIKQTAHGGFIISGVFFESCNFPQTGVYCIVTDSMGNSSCNNPGINITQSPVSFVIDNGAVVGSGSISDTLTPFTDNLYLVRDSTLCFSLGVTDLKNHSNSATVFPNPATLVATIRFANQLQDEYTLTLYDCMGRLLRTIKNINTGEVEIERKDLGPGLYFFRLLSYQGAAVTGKLIFE